MQVFAECHNLCLICVCDVRLLGHVSILIFAWLGPVCVVALGLRVTAVFCMDAVGCIYTKRKVNHHHVALAALSHSTCIAIC